MEDVQNKKPIQPQVPSNVPPINVGASGGAKELERPVSDFVKPSENLVNVENQLKEIGVQQRREFPEVTEQQKAAGAIPSPSAMPVQTEPTGTVHLMSDEEAQREIKEIRNQISVDLRDDSVNFAPSKAFLAVLSDKIRKVLNFFRGRKTQTA